MASSPSLRQHNPNSCVLQKARTGERGAMKVINCECGYIARGDIDEEVVEKIRSHMQEDHPDLYEQVPREDIFGWIEEA